MERLMQYVWQHRLLLHTDMVTVDGRPVAIIDPGQLNTGSGPDFFNAKVSIGGDLWAGDVEIHVRASDWNRHGHDGDRAYDSVILHVVDRDDTAVTRRDGQVIPQMVMKCAPEFHSRYHDLVDRADIDLPCAPELAVIPPLYLTDWITALAYERVYEKVDRINAILEATVGDWEQTCYVTLARALGFGINGEPMQRLATAVPLHFLRKHSDSLLSLEALLFGQGQLLDTAPAADPYVARLIQEHKFYAHKFGLRPLQPLGWKMGRMRPGNFPHRRVAMLASVVAGGFRLLNRIVGLTDTDEAVSMFSAAPSGYWERHYTFGAETPNSLGGLSRGSAESLVINVVVPLMVAYGHSRGDEELVQRAMSMLQDLPPERNSIISMFERAGLKARDAFSSQALIQLRRCYCETRKCLYCRLGHRMLAARARRD